MKLDILACSDVGDAVRIFLAQIGQHLKAARIKTTKRNLDALHPRSVPQGAWPFRVGRGIIDCSCGFTIGALSIVIPLSVSAPAKSGLGENPIFDLALLFQRNLMLEHVQL